MKADDLTIEEKIGQMLIVGVEGNSISDRTKKFILDYKIGGFILYRKNFSTYQEMIDLIKELQELNSVNKVPLFISIDQEGGRVNRMPKEIKNLPPVYEIAKLNDEELIKEDSKIIGEILNKSGFNMNFAPVLDIKRFNDKHAIGNRCFGTNVQDVSKLGIIAMKELQNQGVIPVVKHFPGHGATKTDSHFLLPIINKNIEDLEKEDMLPFINSIEEGADAIMVGHLKINKITGIYPASLSKEFIEKYLRNKYKYNGVIITDDLKMKGIKILFGSQFAMKKAFQSGSDIIVYSFNNKLEKLINRIIKLVKTDKIKQSRIDKSVNRILNLKEKYNLYDKNNIQKIDLDNINKRIDDINKMVTQ